MAILKRSSRFIALAGATCACLNSCTLPPEQAWRIIREDGLIAYLSEAGGSQHAHSHGKEGVEKRSATGERHQTPESSPQPSKVVAENSRSETKRKSAVTGPPLTAQSVPSLPGFVRSPYTDPPRLVDVKGSVPGATMICPYTQRPFLIPADYVNTHGPMVAKSKPEPEAEKPKPKQSPKPEIAAEKPKRPQATEQKEPKVAAKSKPTADKEEESPKNKNKPAPSINREPPTPVAATSSPPPAPAPKPVQEIPFGSAISGRPGFVNSPFAAKQQLVDVTGLPTGMEVKCPYTGKLFRVPPQDVATNKPTEPKPATPASNEAKKN